MLTAIVDRAAERAVLEKLDREWLEAVRQHDLERALSFWAEDAVVLAPGAPALSGKAAIRNFVEKSYQIPGFSISWTTECFSVALAGDLAYGVGTNETTFKDPDGQIVSVAGKSATVWRKDPAGWKCVLDIWNDAPPEAA